MKEVHTTIIDEEQFDRISQVIDILVDCYTLNKVNQIDAFNAMLILCCKIGGSAGLNHQLFGEVAKEVFESLETKQQED